MRKIHPVLLIVLSAAVLFLSGCSLFFPFTISVEVVPPEGGTVEIYPPGDRYGEGDSVNIKAVPEEGYVFSRWEGDLSGYNPEEEFVMDGDKEITAYFESLEPRKWTIMVYLDGDNNLEPEAFTDMNYMELGLYNAENSGNGFPEDSYIIVLVDCLGTADEYGWSGTRLYRLRADGTSSDILSEQLDDGGPGFGHCDPLGELNMGNPETLSWFLERCGTYFPSEKYGLILWNHGGGARSLDPRDICEDTDSSDILNLNEVQTALSRSFSGTEKLDFLGMDACLMGTAEVAYEFRDITECMSFSPANEYGGWAYEEIFGEMTGSTTSAQLARKVVEKYRDKSLSYGLNVNTQTAVDLSSISGLKTALDGLAAAFDTSGNTSTIEGLRDSATHYYENEQQSIAWPYYEIGSLCDALEGSYPSGSGAVYNALTAVRSALSDVIIYAWAGSGRGDYEGAGIGNGLSVFFTRGEQEWDEEDPPAYTHYAYQWWYTEQIIQEVSDPNMNPPYGGIDFADSDSDGTVETWREIFEKWYDPGDSYTPGSY